MQILSSHSKTSVLTPFPGSQKVWTKRMGLGKIPVVGADPSVSVEKITMGGMNVGWPGLAAHDMVDESLLIYYRTSWSLAIRDNVVEGEVTPPRKTWLEDPSKEAPPFSLPFPAHSGAYSDVQKAGDSPQGSWPTWNLLTWLRSLGLLWEQGKFWGQDGSLSQRRGWGRLEICLGKPTPLQGHPTSVTHLCSHEARENLVGGPQTLPSLNLSIPTHVLNHPINKSL